MKNVLGIAILGMCLFSSCKKDWSCNCTSGGVTNPVESYSGFTKKEAQVKCDDVQKDFQEYDSSLTCEVEKK